MNLVNAWNISQNLFYGMITAAITGSVFVILFLLLEKMKAFQYHRIKLYWIKTAQITFLVPITFLAVVFNRVVKTQGGFSYHDDFWRVSTVPMKEFYNSLVLIWLIGMILGIIFRINQYLKLKKILNSNIPIENERCKELIETYQKKYHLRRVSFYKNDRVRFPLTTGVIDRKIILPEKLYKEKELHMILEHEMNHIKSHDLMWKKICLLITFIYWWNPLVYILLNKLILQLEIECDIKTCEKNNYFTMKEYGLYLSGMDEGQDDMIFISAMCKSKKDLFRRIEGMVRVKKCKKWVIAVSSIYLIIMSAIPSYAAAESIAYMNGQWISKTEVSMEESLQKPLVEMTGHVNDEKVTEIDVSDEVEWTVYRSSATVSLDRPIGANTRVTYGARTLQAGDKVTITAMCSNSSIVYRVGIRDNTGHLTYVQGSGTITHTFTIQSNGSYAAYVENRSNQSMTVTGAATYFY